MRGEVELRPVFFGEQFCGLVIGVNGSLVVRTASIYCQEDKKNQDYFVQGLRVIICNGFRQGRIYGEMVSQ